MGAINFLIYKTIEEVNGTGIIGIFQTASQAVTILSSLILSALFIILAYVSFYSTQRRTGYGDFCASCAVAGAITVIVAVLFSFIPNFMAPFSSSILVPRDLIYSIILEIVFVVALFLSREN